MSKDGLFMYLSQYLSMDDAMDLESRFKKMSDEKVNDISSNIRFLKFKNPVIAVVLEIFFFGLCIGRFYIRDFKFVFIVWLSFIVFLFMIPIVCIQLNLFGEWSKLVARYWFKIIVFGIFLYDVLNIMKKTREKNYNQILDLIEK